VAMRGVWVSAPNALIEALHQLFAARQLTAADNLLDRCPREALVRLLASPEYMLDGRIRYEVEDRLRHRKPSHDERAVSVLRALQHVLNTWCAEGRRASIRAVLRELGKRELGEMAGMADIDPEIVSMIREFQEFTSEEEDAFDG
jgi:hypothetical protein